LSTNVGFGYLSITFWTSFNQMARLLAIEWDSHEARVAVAQQRGGQMLLEHAFAVELSPREAGQTFVPVDFGASLSGALASRRIGKVETLVAVGRASIELKVLRLPPAPAEELPELVRFQALREFHSLQEDWPLDFVPLRSEPDQPREVLAAAISPELVKQIRATCESAQLKPRSLVLRPCATASLLQHHPELGGERICLLVDVLADEADLTVLADGQVVFMRTVKLSSHDLQENWAPLVGEIRRTRAAAQNQLGGGRRVEAVYLCGQDEEHVRLAEQIEEKLGLPTRRFDPFSGLALDDRLRRNPPRHPGRYGPLLGMLLDEAGGSHAIDFLNPRRQRRQTGYRREAILGAACAATLLLASVIWLWQSLSDLDADIAALKVQQQSVAQLAESASRYEKEVAEIEKWMVSDIVWLDEIHRLAEKAPPAQQAMLLRLITSATKDGGRIDLEGLVASTTALEQLELALRDESHHPESRGSQEYDQSGRYQWWFNSTIHVDSPLREE